MLINNFLFSLLPIKVSSQQRWPVVEAFHSRSEEGWNDGELKDATEDKEHEDEHPDVKEGDVGNTRNILSNLKELDICQPSQMCYSLS